MCRAAESGLPAAARAGEGTRGRCATPAHARAGPLLACTDVNVSRGVPTPGPGSDSGGGRDLPAVLRGLRGLLPHVLHTGDRAQRDGGGRAVPWRRPRSLLYFSTY